MDALPWLATGIALLAVGFGRLIAEHRAIARLYESASRGVTPR